MQGHDEDAEGIGHEQRQSKEPERTVVGRIGEEFHENGPPAGGTSGPRNRGWQTRDCPTSTTGLILDPGNGHAQDTF